MEGIGIAVNCHRPIGVNVLLPTVSTLEIFPYPVQVNIVPELSGADEAQIGCSTFRIIFSILTQAQ